MSLRHLVAAIRARLNAEQPGQALIMVSIMFMVLIGFVALATDTGMIWMNRRSLQNAADAAALAGVQQLPEDSGTAMSVACDYAAVKNAVPRMYGKSGACASTADVAIYQTYAPNDTIKVTTYKKINPVFGIALGFGSIEIGAAATAMVGSIAAVCPFPIFQTPEMLPGGGPFNLEFYTLTALHLAGSDNASGNFLTVDVGNGAPAVLDAMVNRGCSEPIGPTASTETGGKIGKVVDGFQWRIFCASGQGSQPAQTPSCPAGPSTCPSPDISTYLIQSPTGQFELSPGLTRDNCTRLVVLPIFPGPIDAYTGKTTVTIQGFAIYYIAGVCSAAKCTHPTLGELKKGDSWGYYVRMAGQTDQYTQYNGYGTKVFALVD
jgi:hypothetical protein